MDGVDEVAYAFANPPTAVLADGGCTLCCHRACGVQLVEQRCNARVAEWPERTGSIAPSVGLVVNAYAQVLPATVGLAQVQTTDLHCWGFIHLVHSRNHFLDLHAAA